MAGEMSVRIGQKIRRRRMEMGLNQREFADRIAAQLNGTAPVDGQRVSDWERGINKPSERYLTAIAEVTDRDIGWFYENEDTKTPDLFASDAQVAGGFDEFRGYVAQILAEIRDNRLEIATQNENLRIQTEVLEKITTALADLPAVANGLAALLQQLEAARLPDRRAGGAE